MALTKKKCHMETQMGEISYQENHISEKYILHRLETKHTCMSKIDGYCTTQMGHGFTMMHQALIRVNIIQLYCKTNLWQIVICVKIKRCQTIKYNHHTSHFYTYDVQLVSLLKCTTPRVMVNMAQ